MSERDPFQNLADLARYGEQNATGLPAARVRQLGTRRRHRRHGAIGAAALAIVLLGGGAVFTQTGFQTDRTPDFATTPRTTPAPSPSTAPPVRTVTKVNLLTTNEVPSEGPQQVVETDAGVGRSLDQSSACIPDAGMTALGAQQIRTRNFRFVLTDPDYQPDPSDPLYEQPTIYTQVLQFSDEPAAEAAYRRYTAWVDDCRATLKRNGDTPLGDTEGSTWVTVRTGTPRAVGAWYELSYRLKGDSTGNGYFESVGLTRLGDRLMVTIQVVYGMDYNVSPQQHADPQTVENRRHPQFDLVIAAAKRLTR